MTARSRSFDDRSNMTGTYLNVSIGTSTTRSVVRGANGTCDDVIGNFPSPNSLGITRLNRIYPNLVGKRYNATTGVLEREMINFPLGFHLSPTDPRSQFPALTALGKSNYAWNILSKTNPSAPDVSLPTVLAEMRDIPSLVKNWYSLFLTRTPGLRRGKFGLDYRTPERLTQMIQRLPELIASGHLTWRWAIAPFIRDMKSILTAQTLMNRRMDELRRLGNARGIRKRCSLARNSVPVRTENVILHSEGATVRGTTLNTFTEQVWGSVRYNVSTSALLKSWPRSNAKLHHLAWRLVHGITTWEAMATAWELMPWSWFVDWFAGVGTVINALNNTLGLTHSDCCLMRTTKCVSEISVNPATSDAWVLPLQGDYYVTYERKERFVVAPLLPFAPSYLAISDGRATSILGSLAVLRWRPGRKLESILGPRI